MGIENEAVEDRRLRIPALITPHGDRKPGVRLVDVADETVSLPLMGIENAARLSTPTRRRRSHYPSWGSKTRVDPRRNVAQMRLITPHGDRKLDAAVNWGTRILAHYPSWGSKTARAVASPAIPRSSHYPSWGSKTRGGRRRSAAHRSAHYPSWGSKTSVPSLKRIRKAVSLPLMGIENPRAVRHRHVARLLITPHGDRKRTRRRRESTRCICSLPLMGIENADGYRRGEGRHRDSLPLMGIENAAAGVLMLGVPDLITPHGDRKPGQ